MMCWYAGLDIDGLYRVSGNLAVIQKLRYKADHGKLYQCRGLHLLNWMWKRSLLHFTVDRSTPCCALMDCALVLLQRSWTSRMASGRTFMSSPERWSCFSESFLSHFFHSVTLMTSSQPSVTRFLFWFFQFYGQATKYFKKCCMIQVVNGRWKFYL